VLSELWRCWLDVRKGIRPVKTSDEVLVWLSVWSEVQIVCMWSSWCHCRPKTPSSLASFKSRLVFSFLVPAYPGCPGKEAIKRAWCSSSIVVVVVVVVVVLLTFTNPPAGIGVAFNGNKSFFGRILIISPRLNLRPTNRTINTYICSCHKTRKVKVAHTRLPSVGFRSWSRFLAVSQLVTESLTWR